MNVIQTKQLLISREFPINISLIGNMKNKFIFKIITENDEK